MRKTSFEYHIHGYRYAPESFHIYKGLPGQEKTELRRVGKIKGRNGAAYWDAWATRDKGEFGHSTYMVTVYTKDGIKDNVDDFASSKLGIPKTTKPASPDEIL